MDAPYDIIIIGGGINGCALARQATFAGFSVALVEKNDFGSGVTSRSTRLIHGGLRYLESFQVGLVRESLRDRRLWIDEFPGQATPLQFVIPVYRGDRRAPLYIRAGLAMYGVLARDPRLSAHRAFSATGAREFEPALDGEDLRAAFLYWDGQATWPERVSLEMALQAEEAGAQVRNHFPVEELLRTGNRIVGVRSGNEEIRGRLVINAAGAWIDGVRGLLGGEERKPLLTRVNGAHIVVRPFEGAPKSAVYHEARSDGRPFFSVPWNGLLLVGTTETPYDGDPDRVLPLESEVEYLLKEANLLFPQAGLTAADLAYAYAGSRPLVRADGSNLNAASRDHQIHDHAQSDGVEGLLTLVGGKLTTAPSFAAQAVEAAGRKLGKSPAVVRSSVSPDGFMKAEPRLAQIYGPRTPELTAYLDAAPERRRPVAEGAETTVGEVLFAIEREKAATLGDILLRRTMLAFGAEYRPEWAEAVSRIAADRLQWSDSARNQHLADFQRELGRTLARF